MFQFTKSLKSINLSLYPVLESFWPLFGHITFLCQSLSPLLLDSDDINVKMQIFPQVSEALFLIVVVAFSQSFFSVLLFG